MMPEHDHAVSELAACPLYLRIDLVFGHYEEIFQRFRLFEYGGHSFSYLFRCDFTASLKQKSLRFGECNASTGPTLKKKAAIVSPAISNSQTNHHLCDFGH
jgi:hypothetical protein